LGRALAVAIAIAVAALALCLYSYTSLGSELSSAQSSIHELSASLASASAAISSERSSIASLSSRLGAVSQRLEAAEERIVELQSHVASNEREIKIAMQSIESISRELAEARSAISSLEASVSSLGNRLQNITLVYSERIAELRSRLGALNSDVERLGEEVRELWRGVRSNSINISLAQERISVLERRYESLSSSLANISMEVARLELSLANVSSRLSELSNVVRGELSLYRSEIEFVDQWHFALDDRNYSFVQHLLSRVWREPIVQRIVASRGIWGDLLQRSMQVMIYIESSLAYCHDPYEYVPTLRGVLYWNDLILTPNATISRGCGDCEDLAILAYALLRASEPSGDSEKLFLLAIRWPKGPGHAALLAISRKYVVIVDPAGDWINGITLLLELRSGSSKLLLFPLGVSNATKRFLMRLGVASIVFYDNVNSKIYSYPVIYVWSPSTVVEEWISYWGSTPTEIDVYGLHTFKVFTSVSSFINWIEREQQALQP